MYPRRNQCTTLDRPKHTEKHAVDPSRAGKFRPAKRLFSAFILFVAVTRTIWKGARLVVHHEARKFM